MTFSERFREGAQAFLVREYRVLAVFAIVVGVLLGVFVAWATAAAFGVGAACSALTGYAGMAIAVRANGRTAQAASESLNLGLRLAFNSGAVMGSAVVGVGRIGLSAVWLVMLQIADAATAASTLAGFSFGASAIALFARVGGASIPRRQMSARTSWARWKWDSGG